MVANGEGWNTNERIIFFFSSNSTSCFNTEMCTVRTFHVLRIVVYTWKESSTVWTGSQWLVYLISMNNMWFTWSTPFETKQQFIAVIMDDNLRLYTGKQFKQLVLCHFTLFSGFLTHPEHSQTPPRREHGLENEDELGLPRIARYLEEAFLNGCHAERIL